MMHQAEAGPPIYIDPATVPPPPKQPPIVTVGSPWPGDGPFQYTSAGTGGWTLTHIGSVELPPPLPPPPPLRDIPRRIEGNVPQPPPPPHVEPQAPSLNPFATIGRLISGVNVPPAVAGVARALLEAAAVGALSKAASLLAVAHVPVEYAALAAAGVMVLRATEGIVDQWGKGG